MPNATGYYCHFSDLVVWSFNVEECGTCVYLHSIDAKIGK